MVDTDSSASDFLLQKIFNEGEEEEKDENVRKHSNADTSTSDNEEYNKNLHARIVSLRETISILKAQLQEEREIWKREMEEKNDLDFYNTTNIPGFQFYDNIEHDFQRYQDVLMQSHYESRQMIQKQIAFANYKRRLLEVENMCNLEMLRVKQSVQILQPLQMIASEWKLNDGGNTNINKIKEIDVENMIKKEVEMPLEALIQNAVPSKAVTSEPSVTENNSNLTEKSQSQPNMPVSDLNSK